MIPEITSIETARLRAEALSERHLRLLLGLWQDERVMAQMVGGVRSEAECRDRLQKMAHGWTQFGLDRWALFDKQTTDFVGVGGLRHNIIDGWPEIELGYSLHTAYWGQGLATEIAQAALGVGFTRLGCEHICAMALVSHSASRRVLEKVGMKLDREMLYRDTPHVRYEITHAAWRAAHPAP